MTLFESILLFLILFYALVFGLALLTHRRTTKAEAAEHSKSLKEFLNRS